MCVCCMARRACLRASRKGRLLLLLYPCAPPPPSSYFSEKRPYWEQLEAMETPGRVVLLRRLRGGDPPADGSKHRWDAGGLVLVRAGRPDRRGWQGWWAGQQAHVGNVNEARKAFVCQTAYPSPAVWVERGQLVGEGILLSRHQITDHYTKRILSAAVVRAGRSGGNGNGDGDGDG